MRTVPSAAVFIWKRLLYTKKQRPSYCSMTSHPPHMSHDIGPTIDTEFLQITVKASSKQEAYDLIRLLTEQRLVACAQVQGSESAGFQVEDAIWRCRFKTSRSLHPLVESETKRFFSGRPHEIKSLPIVKGSRQFLEWLKTQLS